MYFNFLKTVDQERFMALLTLSTIFIQVLVQVKFHCNSY